MMPIYLTNEARVKESLSLTSPTLKIKAPWCKFAYKCKYCKWLNLTSPMIKITTYWSLVKFCDIWLSFVIWDVLILYGMFSDGTFSHGMIRDGGTFCVGLVLCYKSALHDCRFIPAWYLTIYIREKVEICEKKRWKKNTPNVGGENAAKVAGKKSTKM